MIYIGKGNLLQAALASPSHVGDCKYSIQSTLAPDGFISRLATTKERISELEDISMECSKWKSKDKKDKGKNRTEYPRTMG